MQFLYELRLKYQKLMYDRNGIDKLCVDIVMLWLVVGVLNTLIFRSRVISLIALLLPIYAAFRMLSKETNRRSRENLKYIHFRTKAIGFFKVQFHRIKEIKTHRYYKCKNCSSYLRVKRKKGKTHGLLS